MKAVDAGKRQDDFREALCLLTVRIVTAYLARNPVPPGNVSPLLTGVHAALVGLVRPDAAGPAPEQPTLAEIRRSVQQDGIVSFIDGRSYKTLKRHLTAHGLTPARYRARYGLPDDYPVTAPGYAAQRSKIAKGMPPGRDPA